jgi:hypothetical protein
MFLFLWYKCFKSTIMSYGNHIFKYLMKEWMNYFTFLLYVSDQVYKFLMLFFIYLTLIMQRDSIVVTPHMAYSVPWTSLLLHYSHSPSSFSSLFQTVFGGLLCPDFTCTNAAYLHPLHPSNPFLSSLHVLTNTPLYTESPLYIHFLSTNEWQHAIFDLLSVTHLAHHDNIQFHPFSCKWYNLVLLYGQFFLYTDNEKEIRYKLK